MSDHLTATGLRYDGTGAPTVTLSGQKAEARRIIAEAREQSIPILKHPSLAQALDPLQVSDEIPESLYLIIAEILVLVYQLEGRADPRTSRT
ncbi:flagellar protein FhlB [Litorivicinus lipolyticus]|uniref:Flagellar biosynthetic protein FlhB n=1 Tax=Litorivicinus lipolyticus TaxID=418701 RepID=A0A5Q2QCK1_9GAMM|nr:EscU/YscU/HrcU family type III secretion system export apparatus switch protein [Litorivicinus lipolyticus]QGG80032.1 flagellar protein FhlB [Litorivicinus lipolyticus]